MSYEEGFSKKFYLGLLKSTNLGPEIEIHHEKIYSILDLHIGILL